MADSVLWESARKSIKKSKRKYEEVPDSVTPYRIVKLFCEKCGKSLGLFDVYYTDFTSYMYCSNCVKEFIKETPIILNCGTITKDYGNSVEIKYENDYYNEIKVSKTCYFTKKGRYIKVKGKRYYI